MENISIVYKGVDLVVEGNGKKFNKEKELILLYNEGKSLKEIADIFSINITTIYNVLKRNNIQLRRLLNINEQLIVEEYLISNNISELKNKYKTSFGRIKNILLKNNIDTTLNFRKYAVKEDYFKVIDTHDKAYFLGLLYADGYINNEGFFISLCEKDLSILKSFKKYIGYLGEIKTKTYKNNKHCTQKQLNIYSNTLSKDLILLGCTQNKSHTIKYPYFLDDEYHSHFIRGVFDGDGSVHKISKHNKIGFSIIGNYDLIYGIVDILVKCANTPKRNFSRDKRCKGNIVSFRYTSDKDLLLIYNYLYKNSESIRISRKYLTFKKYLNEKGLL